MFKFTRRDSLGMMLALAATGCKGWSGSGDAPTPASPPPPPPHPPPPPPPPPPPGSLKTSAGTKNMRFGSAVAWSAPGADAGSFANPAYAALLEHDCSILVPENELKWQSLQPTNSPHDFARFDAILNYAEAKGMAMRGHTLVWHQSRWMPAWLESYNFGPSPATEAERILTQHVQAVCRRYGNRIVSYDVVNEAVVPATGLLYETALSRALGGAQKTLDLAFHTARAEAPSAQLVYNDYMSWEPGGERHRSGVLEVLKGFRARGVPVDALGLQSHLGIYSSTPVATLVANQTPTWRAFLNEVVAMGYKLVITELDVRDDGLPADIAVRDQAIADYTRGYLDVMFAYPELRDVLVWGMCDKYSWLQRMARTDGLPRRPCPYDAGFKPKSMHSAIDGAFKGAALQG